MMETTLVQSTADMLAATGSTFPYAIAIGVVALALIAGFVLFFARRRKVRPEDDRSLEDN